MPITQTNQQSFNVGDGLATLDTQFVVGAFAVFNEQPFNVIGPDLVVTFETPFNVGEGEFFSVQPFNVGDTLGITLNTPFYVGSRDTYLDRGAYVAGEWQPGLLLFGINGAFLGSFDATVSQPPAALINDTSSAQFFVPRTLYDSGLVVDDRIVLFANELGFRWAGPITVQDSGEGQVKVTVNDLMQLWADVDVAFDIELADNTPALRVYAYLLKAMNEHWAGVGEMAWRIPRTTVQPQLAEYFGDFVEAGDGLSVLQAIADRSLTEWYVDPYISPDGWLQPRLRVADRFEHPDGAAIFDGPGGNVATPTYTHDVSNVVYCLRLTGSSTEIVDLVPDWAQWAVHEYVPELTLCVPTPAGRRTRSVAEVSVDWSFSKTKQKALAQKLMERLWGMFYQYLYAFHDEEGRVFHEGFAYSGPPEEIDNVLHTGLGWRTRQRMVEVKGKPAAAVMRSGPEGQILVVEYNRVTGVQTVKRRWFSDADGILSATKMSIHGWARWFKGESGGYLQDFHDATNRTYFHHSMALVTRYAFKMPYVHDDGEISWHTVRRVISLLEAGAVTEGAYFIQERPVGPTTDGQTPYLRHSIVSVPETVEPESIHRVYGFEKYRIRDWDPRRDGVGARLNRPSVRNNAESTRTRWFRVSWGEKGDASTQLQQGIYPGSTKILVESLFGFPTRPRFQVVIGEDPGSETVTVTKVLGTEWTVIRGTNAHIHEAGETVALVDPEPWDGFVFKTGGWGDGQRYAERLLAKLSQPFTRLATEITNEDGSWLTVRLGSIHAATIGTEGPLPGIIDTVRVIGYTVDDYAGTLELLLEPA